MGGFSQRASPNNSSSGFGLSCVDHSSQGHEQNGRWAQRRNLGLRSSCPWGQPGRGGKESRAGVRAEEERCWQA